MKDLCKPAALRRGDTVATISCCNGWAGDEDIRWKYNLGVKRLEELGLNVVASPNSLKGSSFLSKNPQARAEDFMWAFENKDVKAIIANIGGNDSVKIIPYINASVIKSNPKIFIGMSDVTNLHMLCYQNSLATFYGDNLLNSISEPYGWNEYSKYWFERTLFNCSEIGLIEPSEKWTCDKIDYCNPKQLRTYCKNDGYMLIQGKNTVKGKLFGGSIDTEGFGEYSATLSASDFEGAILFIESIPQFFTAENIIKFLNWLDKKEALQAINGIIIGKANEKTDFAEQKKAIKEYLTLKDLSELPVLYGLNFGHSSPSFILPYGTTAEINCKDKNFSITDFAVETN